MVSWRSHVRLAYCRAVGVLCSATSTLWAAAKPHAPRFSKAIKAIEFSLSLACIIGALSVGGDMLIAGTLLTGGWIFAAIGVLSISDLSLRSRRAICILLTIVFFLIFEFLYEHHKNDPDIAGAVNRLEVHVNDMDARGKLISNPGPLEPDTNLGSGRCAPKYQYNISVGAADYGTNTLPYTAIEMVGEPFLTLKRAPNGGIAASFNLYDGQDRVLAEVHDNAVLVPPLGLAYMRARSDLHSLEAADIHGDIRLKIYYKNTKNIIIEGNLYRHGRRIEANANETVFHVGPLRVHLSNSEGCSNRGVGAQVN